MLNRRLRQLRIAWRRTFRQRAIAPEELPGIMRKHIYTGAMGNIWASLVTGLFFVVYGNAIGMTPFLWGVLTGISSLAPVGQLVSAFLTQRSGQRKLIWFLSALVARVLRLVAVLVSLGLWWLGWRGAAAALIAGVCLCNLFGAVAAPPWMSWLADLIPERKHGGFWSRRTAWIDIAVGLTVLPASLLHDRVPEAWKVPTAVAIFCVATIVGIVDLFIHNTLPEPPMTRVREAHFLRHLLAPLRDAGFRPWLAFVACWHFSMTLGGGLSLVYMAENLGIRRNLLGGNVVLLVVPMIVGALVSRRTGQLVDRVGSKPVLQYGHLFWALLPGFWVFATPRTALIWLGVQGIITGTATRAATIAANKLVTRYPAPEDVAMYSAVSSCLASLASGLGAFVAGSVVRAFGTWSVTLLGWTFIGFHVVFIVSMCLRLTTALLLIPRIREAGKKH